MKTPEEIRRAVARIAHDALAEEIYPPDKVHDDDEEQAIQLEIRSLLLELQARGMPDGPDFLYTPEFETLTIEGTAYGYDIFTRLGHRTFRPGQCFATLKHEHGFAHLRDIRPILEQARELLSGFDELDLETNVETARTRLLADLESVLKGRF